MSYARTTWSIIADKSPFVKGNPPNFFKFLLRRK